MLTIYLVALTVFAAPQSSFYGAVPEDVPTFVVQSPQGELHAGIQIDGEWWRERSPRFPQGTVQAVLIPDMPWESAQRHNVVVSQLEISPEPRSTRRDRLQRGWEGAGYSFVQTPEGLLPVSQEELELAQRAERMAQQVHERSRARTGEGRAYLQRGKRPGLVEQYAGHVVVAAVGLLLIALVIRFTFT